MDAVVRRVDLNRALAGVDIEELLARIDLDALVARLDIDAIVDRIDLDRAVGRMDLDRVVHSIDLVALANEVIDGVDLPEIIRAASTSVTADVMTDVRSSGERADDAVANAIGRLLRRKAAVDTVAPDGPESGGDV
ncbi:hypothetical protein GOARA_056_01560 [Gordonia araii NBRC 100433]|uniref:Uncharacterized protein n=1 Tax=Gordonia araii NBRC 100433 TaxID=1073574 RepID=G7H3I3_9ACTN|nr:hypothetical protein [Gordonia araii]NNG96526.1 hypothetical protein [Gordonia araii NBRC 100433]GAB10408.1 hypothetical protein GOARA_056_01560 [Gordonia araii NBRC 100433]